MFNVLRTCCSEWRVGWRVPLATRNFARSSVVLFCTKPHQTPSSVSQTDSRDVDLRKLLSDTYSSIASSCLSWVQDQPVAARPALRYFEQVLRHAANGGKLTRAMTFLRCYSCLCPDIVGTKPLRPNAAVVRQRVAVVAWCIELDNLGLHALNHALLLEALLFRILRREFGNTVYYGQLLDIFHQALEVTISGQELDWYPMASGEPAWDLYTPDYYEAVVRSKTAHYTYYLPAQVACLLMQSSLATIAADVLYRLGYMFQVQDDYLDVYGDSALMGKEGRDIAEGKCAWPIVTALRLTEAGQAAAGHQRVTWRDALLAHYGRPHPDAIAAVRRVFAALHLPQHYARCELQLHDQITTHIGSLDVTPAAKHWLLSVLKDQYRRQR